MTNVSSSIEEEEEAHLSSVLFLKPEALAICQSLKGSHGWCESTSVRTRLPVLWKQHPFVTLALPSRFLAPPFSPHQAQHPSLPLLPITQNTCLSEAFSEVKELYPPSRSAVELSKTQGRLESKGSVPRSPQASFTPQTCGQSQCVSGRERLLPVLRAENIPPYCLTLLRSQPVSVAVMCHNREQCVPCRTYVPIKQAVK